MPGAISVGSIPSYMSAGGISSLEVPLRFDNLQMWLDASKLIGAEGDTLAEWNNLIRSPTSNTDLDMLSSGAGGPNLILSTQNGLNVVRFDGLAADHMQTGGTLTWVETMPWTIYVVARRSVGFTQFHRVFYTTAGEVGFTDSADNFYAYAGAAGFPQIAAADANYHVFYAEMNSDASNLAANDSETGTTDVGTLNPDSELFLSHNSASPLNGDIAELIVYTDSQSSDEVDIITHHLLRKWGLST